MSRGRRQIIAEVIGSAAFLFLGLIWVVSFPGLAMAQSLIGGDFAISTVPGSAQFSPAIASDGTNYLVVWTDTRTFGATSTDIYGARVTANGIILDPGGFPISTAAGFQENPAVAFDGTNYLVVWEDNRAGTGFSDIYGARVSPQGQVLDPGGFAISTAANFQFVPAVAFDGANYLVVWEDRRDGVDSPIKIFGTRVSPAGVVVNPDGFAISDPAFGAARPAIAFDGVNYLVVYGRDVGILNATALYGTRVSPTATVLDPGGFVVSGPSTALVAQVAFDGANYLAVWSHRVASSGPSAVFGARVSPAAIVLDPGGFAISASPAVPIDKPILAFAGGNYLVAWVDFRTPSEFNIFGTLVTPAGLPTQPQGVLLSTFPHPGTQGVGFGPAVGRAGTRFLAAWVDFRNTESFQEFDLYGQLVGPGAGSFVLLGYDQTSDILVKIDRTTAEPTPIGPVGLGPGAVVGLAYDSRTDTLFGVKSIDVPNVPTHSQLVVIDRVTGKGTLVAPISMNDSGLVVGVTDLTTGPNNTLYGLMRTEGSRSFIFTIDPATARGTRLGDATFVQSEGLAYQTQTGKMFAVSTFGNLFEINPLTGECVSCFAGGAGPGTVDLTTDPTSGDLLALSWEFPAGCFLLNLTSGQRIGRITNVFGAITALESVSVSNSGPRAPPITAGLGSSSQQVPSGMTSEPINTATGNYFFQRTDLAIPGRGLPVIFTRTYNSLDTYAGPLGPGWTHSYNVLLSENPDGSVVIKQGDGREEFYDPVGGGNFRSRFAGVFSVLVKNLDGTFTLSLKNHMQYRFSATKKLTSIVDRNGNAVSLTYDVAGNLATITDTVGRIVTLSYDGSGRITQISDPIGRTILYRYDATGNLASVTDPRGGVMTFAYDASHRVTEIRDERGNRLLTNSYDGAGRVATQTNGRGFTTTLAYGTPRTEDTTIMDPRGNSTIHTHDNLRRLVHVTDATGGLVSFIYDADNNRTGITDQNSKTTLLTYDGRGNVASITDPRGQSIAFTYDGQNNLTNATNARGFTTIFTYDVPGNLASIQDASGNVTGFSYDSFGQLGRKMDARGNVTQYAYDGQENLTRITDALGGITILAYDGIGRLLSLTDPKGHTATAGYEANSRLTQIVDPLSNVTRFTYDPVGNLIEILDAKFNRTRYAYDEVNNLTAVTDALGNVTRYTYDANNNRTTLINASARTTAYTFDPLNRLSRITDPLGHATTYAYDPVGNVRTVADANGLTNTFSYDANNRLIGISYGDGASVTYSYDANGNRAGMVDARGTTAYTYDALDRLVAVAHPTAMVGYDYDAVGNRTSLAYPDSGVVTYGYDALNRLARVTDREGQGTSYTYDAASNLFKVAYSNGTAISYQYDAANRLVKVANTRVKQTLTTFAYALDQLGNRLSRTKDGKFVTSYAYDALSQLVNVTNPAGIRTDYTYDAVRNRLTSARTGQVTQFTYDAADRLLQAGKQTFTYDANGNRTSMTAGVVTTYTYDAANRLVRVVRGTDTAAYEYDGDGNKITQVLGLDVFRFVNDVATALPVVLTEAGPSQNLSYVWGNALISASALGAKNFYHYDGLGSVIALTDLLGNQSAVYAYDSWGAPEGAGHASPSQNRFRFTGEEVDDLTGFYYLRARWYDPSVGKFMSKDPLPGFPGQPQSLNRYAYVRNNPIRYVDPSGRNRQETAAVLPQVSLLTGPILGTAVSTPIALPQQMRFEVSPRAEIRTAPDGPPLTLEDIKEWTEENRTHTVFGANQEIVIIKALPFILKRLIPVALAPSPEDIAKANDVQRQKALKELSYRCYPFYEYTGFDMPSRCQ